MNFAWNLLQDTYQGINTAKHPKIVGLRGPQGIISQPKITIFAGTKMTDGKILPLEKCGHEDKKAQRFYRIIG